MCTETARLKHRIVCTSLISMTVIRPRCDSGNQRDVSSNDNRFQKDGIGQESTCGDNATIRPFEWLTSPESLRTLLADCRAARRNPGSFQNALHVGSGSSVVGEFLVEQMELPHVINIDRDSETLQQMQHRWKCLHGQGSKLQERLQFVTYDFDAAEAWPFPDTKFDLILDKSTLDCTLCSDQATANLLNLVQAQLAVDGVYVLISFHELDLLRPLLEKLPGVDWTIHCSKLARQVEQLGIAAAERTTESALLNVLVACKQSDGDATLQSFEAFREHVHAINDEWFQQQHPLVTRQRKRELEQHFHSSSNNNSNNSIALPLSEAFLVLFTDAEREHLTYEHFLEDWQAYCEDHEDAAGVDGAGTGLKEDGPSVVNDTMTFKVAVSFLEAMQ